MDELALVIGQNIRKRRKERGLTQDDFALVSKIDRSYIGRIERGEANLTVEKLYIIAAVLDCEPASLLPSKAILRAGQ